MKAFKSIQLNGINIAIYAFLIFISFAALGKVWKVYDRMHYQTESGVPRYAYPRIISPANNTFITLKEDVLKTDQRLFERTYRNSLIYGTIKDLFHLILLFLVIIQLRMLLNSLKKETFFIHKNLYCVRRISYLLVTWVIIDFLLYQCFQFFIPLNIIQENYNYLPINRGVIYSLLLSIEYVKLLAAFAFYVISVVFKEGSKLKEQTDLTI